MNMYDLLNNNSGVNITINAGQLIEAIDHAVAKTRKDLAEQVGAPYPESEQLLTIQQAGEILNLSVPTLYGYVHRAEIPVCKRGKRLYFSKQELLEWIKQGRKKTFAETTVEAEYYLKNKGGK